MRAKNPMEQFFIFSLYNAGLCYQKLNEHTNALKYLRKAMLVNPASPEVLNAIGFSYYSLMVASSNKSQQK
jgi:tetratricopeptide (TPR) repeat protein